MPVDDKNPPREFGPTLRWVEGSLDPMLKGLHPAIEISEDIRYRSQQ
jgi:hypothetical protein